MKRTALALIIMLLLLGSAIVGVLFSVFSGIASTSSPQASSPEQASKNQYQTFLTNIMGIDLSKYYVNTGNGPNHGPESGYGYGVNYPSIYGGFLKEEALSCHLDSPQSNATSWGLIDNGAITSLSLTTVHGSVFYTQSPAKNMLEEAKNFFQKYQTFLKQFYGQNTETSYIQQALSSLSGVNLQISTDKTVGNMHLKITPNQSIFWSYTQNNISTTMKGIRLNFVNNRVTSFGDTWNLYSVSNATSISRANAESIAFSAAKNYRVTLFQGPNLPGRQVTPDWSNMTYESTPSWAIRNSLTLYPFWHFIFYFDKPIGGVVGIEVGAWGDTKELSYCHEYGYLS